ncbi:MAG: sensor histidine kinase, partial [Kordiimonas sp.]
MPSPIPDHLNPYGKKFILFQLVFWFLYFFVYRSLWFSYTPPAVSWSAAYMFTGWLSTTLLAMTIWSTRRKSFKTQIMVGGLGCVFFGVLWRVNIHAIEWHILEVDIPEVITPFAYIHNGFFATVHLMAWSAGYFLIAYYTQYLHQQERAAKAELLAKEAQIKLLHLQISPHFLFNVLNSLDTLLIKENINESREMLSKLSLFLRQTLSEEPTHKITLKEEIERTKSYLDIELVRFRDKLKINWNCDPKLDEFSVPSLILQPIVENAIKHCVGKSMHGGIIEIEAI